jgi:O-antigen/teichoic acid export membrane protein
MNAGSRGTEAPADQRDPERRKHRYKGTRSSDTERFYPEKKRVNQDAEKAAMIEDSPGSCLTLSPPPDDSVSPGTDASASSRQRFSVQIAWTLTARIVAVACNVAAGVIVARWLGAAGVGALAVLNVAVATAVLLGSAGLPSTNTYFVAGDRNSLPSVTINTLIFSLAAGSALALAVVAWASARTALFNDMAVGTVAIASASIPFQLLLLLGANIFLGAGSIGWFNAFDTLRQSFMLLNVIVVLIAAGGNLQGLVSANTTASVLLSALIMWAIYRYMKRLAIQWRWRPDGRLFRQMARYGFKFHVATLVPLLIFRADLLIVKYFRRAAEAGVYDVATQVSSMLMLLPGVVGALLFPRVTVAQDRQGTVTCRATRHTAFIMLVICLATVPAALALPVIYGPAFADATVQLWLLLPGVFLIGIESVLVQHFSALGLPATIPLFWMATLVVNVILNFVLVPAWGARGAAFASAVSYTMIFVLVAAYFRARTGQRVSAMLLLSVPELRALLALEGFSFRGWTLRK